MQGVLVNFLRKVWARWTGTELVLFQFAGRWELRKVWYLGKHKYVRCWGQMLFLDEDKEYRKWREV